MKRTLCAFPESKSKCTLKLKVQEGFRQKCPFRQPQKGITSSCTVYFIPWRIMVPTKFPLDQPREGIHTCEKVYFSRAPQSTSKTPPSISPVRGFTSGGEFPTKVVYSQKMWLTLNFYFTGKHTKATSKGRLPSPAPNNF